MHPGPTPLARTDHPAFGYWLAVVGTAVAVIVAALAEQWFGLADLSLVFMLAVMVVATRTSTGPAMLAAVLCFLALNFFFVAPRYSFYIDARHGVATVALFLAAALLAGRLASALAMQVHALRIAHQHESARRTLAARLSAATDEGAVVQAARDTFAEALGADVWVRLDVDGTGTRHAASVEEHGWWFLPLRAGQGTLGLVGLKMPDVGSALDQRQRDTARAMADDVAQALLRTRLATELETARVANETERLRSALLSSVSHDLRTPLASMIGAAGSLETYGDAMDDADRRSLLDAIRVEGQRLDRYIQNLLDMTRLGHGGLVLHRDWIGVDELIGAATGRLQRQAPGARFTLHIAPMDPIWVHPALVEQALFNVVENAAKFSPPGEPIAIEAGEVDGAVRIDVVDAGPGIPDAERQRIFDQFYSAARGDRGRHGTGLGLAICRGMIGAHGGDVEALPGPGDRGTRIRITLPRIEPDHADPDAGDLP